MQPLQCGSQHQLANLHLSTHRTTPEHQMTTVMQPFQCDLQAQIPKHPITTHTSTPKAASSHRYTAAKKNDKPTAAAPVAHTRYLSSSPAATLHGKTQGFVLRLPPQNHSPCNIMQPLQCGLQHQLANLHLSTHRTTPEHQMTTVMQPFQCDLQAQIPKHPITTHTQAQLKQLEATVTLRQKKTTNRPQPHPSHTRGSFHRRLQPLYTENTRFRAPASSPNHSPCNIHAAMTNNEAAIPLQSATRDSRTA